MGYYGNNDWRDYRGKIKDQFMHSEYSDNDYRDYLAHYGVKGMKWGKSIASLLSSGAHAVGGGIVSGAHAVGGAIGSGVNNVLTMVGLKKDPKKKHTRGVAKKKRFNMTGWWGNSHHEKVRLVSPKAQRKIGELRKSKKHKVQTDTYRKKKLHERIQNVMAKRAAKKGNYTYIKEKTNKPVDPAAFSNKIKKTKLKRRRVQGALSWRRK